MLYYILTSLVSCIVNAVKQIKNNIEVGVRYYLCWEDRQEKTIKNVNYLQLITSDDLNQSFPYDQFNKKAIRIQMNQ